jgi:hypothetical protein
VNNSKPIACTFSHVNASDLSDAFTMAADRG